MGLTKLVLFAGLLILGTTVLGAGPNDQVSTQGEDQAIQNPKPLSFETNTTYQVLDHTVDLWHDAILKGDDKRSNFHFSEIHDIISEDLQSDKLQMRMLVREIEYRYRINSAEEKNLINDTYDDEDIIRYKKYLPIISSSICIKEELRRALSRTDAFSNKYRLLGDYKNLLRRELGMPKLEVADIHKNKSNQASTDK